MKPGQYPGVFGESYNLQTAGGAIHCAMVPPTSGFGQILLQKDF
jgi:hypothetical protein